MNNELLIFLTLAIVFGPPSLWAFHVLHKRSLARWASEQANNVQSTPSLATKSQLRPTLYQNYVKHQATQQSTIPKKTPAVKPTVPQPLQASIASLTCALMLDQLDQATHVMIVGPTNAGKTTVARALLLRRIQAGEQVVIIDPHATTKTWGGLAALGNGRAYEEITPVLEALLSEMSNRYQQLSADASIQLQPITLVVDEWPSIQNHCGKQAGTWITQVAQEGRKVGMRLIVLAQSDRVESLGIHGKGDVRNNFTTLLLGTKAQECVADAAHQQWPAVLKEPTPQLVDTTGLPRLAEVVFAADCVWQPQLVAPAELADVLEPASEDPILHHLLQPIEEAETEQVAAEITQDDELSQMLRVLLDAGFTRTTIVKHLHFAPNRNAAFRRIRQAIGEEGEQAQAA